MLLSAARFLLGLSRSQCHVCLPLAVLMLAKREEVKLVIAKWTKIDLPVVIVHVAGWL